MRARLQANESAVQEALKTIVAAEVEYRTTNSQYANLTQLGSPISRPPYIDDILSAGTKNGYRFTTSDIAAYSFHCSAVPVSANVTGVRSFCAMEDGVLRVQATGGAIADHTACSALPGTNP
jgi:hypothetical protein